jgi:uncharacterized protein
VAENADVVRSGYEAFARGDLDAVMENYADDSRWEGSNFEAIPGGGTREGRDAIRQMIGEIEESWEEFEASPDEFIEQDDTVVVLGHLSGKTKSGEQVKVPFVNVFRMSGGKVQRVQALTDTAVVAQALGVV